MAAFMAGSTYSSTIDNAMEMMHGQGWMEEKHRKMLGKRQPGFGSKWKQVLYQRQPPKSFYMTDYGSYGDGVANMLPSHPLGLSAAGSTADLFRGTNKAVGRIPGYTGLVPEEEASKANQNHAAGNFPDSKDCLLLTLQQFKLQIPGTSIFEPRDAANLAKGPKGRVGTATHFNVRPNPISRGPLSTCTGACLRTWQ